MTATRASLSRKRSKRHGKMYQYGGVKEEQGQGQQQGQPTIKQENQSVINNLVKQATDSTASAVTEGINPGLGSGGVADQTLQQALINTIGILTFYSPIIICMSVLVVSMFTVTIEKAMVYFMWIFVITFLRIILLKGFREKNRGFELNAKCKQGLTDMFIPNDVTYGTYILAFTMMYFLVPMLIISVQHNKHGVNYGAIAFFLSYLAMDVMVKKSYQCLQQGWAATFMDIIGAMFLGTLISGFIMYSSSLRAYLFINEINTNGEVCNVPSKRQFKCRVYKDGELIGNM